MCFKMCVSVALCFISLLALSESFFMPPSVRKQPDCVRRAPQTTGYNNQHWVPTSGSGNTNGGNTIQGGFGNLKDFNPYQQQQQQQQQPQQQQLQQQGYPPQLQNIQGNVPKYEQVPFQSINQPQYMYEGVYGASFNSYPQSVQLVPCLCPVNKEVIEQQNQQLQQLQQQQSSLPISPTSSSFPVDSSNNNATPQGVQKKNS